MWACASRLVVVALPVVRCSWDDRGPLLVRATEGLGCAASLSPSEASDCLLGRLYPPGYDHGDAEEGDDSFDGDTYGESTPAGIRMLSPHVRENFGGAALGNEDVFLDVGSGFGKAAVQLFTEGAVRASYGVELHHGRCAVAREAAASLAGALGVQLEELPPLQGDTDVGSVEVEADGRRLGLLCGDAFSLPEWDGGLRIEDVTVVMANSLCFPPSVMISFQLMLQLNLPPGALVYSSQALRGCHRGLINVGRLHMKDTNSIPGLFHAYIVAPRPSAFVFVSALGGHPASEPPNDVTRGRWSSSPPSVDSIAKAVPDATWAQGRASSPTECVLADLAWWLHASPGPDVWGQLLAADPSARRFQGGAEFVTSKLLNIFAPPQDAAHALYKQALEYRSPSLLRALHAGALNLTAERVSGRTLCHHELTAGARGRGDGLLMMALLPQLDGEDQMLAPPGRLLTLLQDELGVSCAAPDLTGRLPLHLAAQAGHEAMAELLLAATGPKALQAKDHHGSSPLHLAARKDVARLLLEVRADVAATDQAGLSPFIAVAARAATWASTPLSGNDLLNEEEEEGCPMSRDLVQLLAESRAEVGALSADSWTALHHVAGAEPKLFTRPDAIAGLLVQPLLELRLDVNAQDSAGRTPLHCATHGALARQLLEGRADVHAKDKKGRTALKSARRRRPGYSALKRVLEEFGEGGSGKEEL